MLRKTTTPLFESHLGTQTQTESQPSQAPHLRHLGRYQQPNLLLEKEPSVQAIAQAPINSIERNATLNSRQHQRHRSASSLVTTRSLHPSTISRPRGHSVRHSVDMALTGDGRVGRSPAHRAGYTSRASTPPPMDRDSAPLAQQVQTPPVDTTPRSVAQTRLGFFASSVSAFTSRMSSPAQIPTRTDDELYDLDIEAALFPALSPQDGDAFSPAAYKNLQLNATGLLHRMQDALRRRTIALREFQAEREAQNEEVEEMELRTRHFKSQLETMAAKAAEQEKAMQQLMAELQAEKQARLEERASREKMLRAVGEDAVMGSEELRVDEDERKSWRASNSTVKSELSIDTDGDSAESESIFSRSRSPTAMTCITENESLDVPPGLHLRAAAPLPPPKPKPAQQLTAFQRLVKGMKSSENGNSPGSDTGCRNCKGQDSSVAWNTVSLLRDENIALKQRVAQLDVVIEGALDVVHGFKT